MQNYDILLVFSLFFTVPISVKILLSFFIIINYPAITTQSVSDAYTHTAKLVISVFR
jgi:hypothetical protein